MTNVVPLRATLDVALAAPLAPVQSEASASFQVMCLNRFLINSKARGHSSDYIKQVLSTVRAFLNKVGPLETVTEAKYEAWTADCATVLKNARSTQRTKQKHIRRFIEYVHGTHDLQNEAVKAFGQRIVLFAHKRNSIIHTSENESERRTPAFTAEELDLFFAQLDRDAERAMTESPREVRALLRDKAMFYVIQEFGPRVSEVRGITWGDWDADSAIPECGPYARLHIRLGKAARGSGKRHRVVPATDPLIHEVMQWYRERVYPLFDIEITPTAPVFPSERRKGISRGEVAGRFTRVIEAAGLAGRDLTPHSLRRSMVTTAVLLGGHEFARYKAGHKSGYTTQLYTHIPFEQYTVQAKRLVDQVVDNARQRPSAVAGSSTTSIETSPTDEVLPSERRKDKTRGEVAAPPTQDIDHPDQAGNDLAPRSFKQSGVTKTVPLGGQNSVRQQAGYKTGSTTQHYTQIPPEHYTELADRLIDPVVEKARQRSSPSSTSAGEPSNRTTQNDRDGSDEGALA